MKRALPWIAGVLLLTAVLVVGLTQASGDARTVRRAAARRSISTARERSSRARPRRSPPCTSSPRELLDGGVPAFEKRLAALKGTPVVINKWASWCDPCRAEFPVFQQLATERGREIAFLGVNSGDSTQPARDFLAEYPVPFPSYLDPDEKIAQGDQGAGQLPRSRCSSTRAGRPRSSTRAATRRPLNRARTSTDISAA